MRTSTLREVVDLYLCDVEARCEAKHATNVRTYLEAVLAACPACTTAEILVYRVAQQRAGLANRTINFAVGCARTCLRWARSLGLIRKNPLRGLRRLPQREGDLAHRRRAMTDAEVVRFLAAAAKVDRKLFVAQVPLWTALLEVGPRFGEMAALRPEDRQKDELVIRPETNKSRRGRRVPIPPSLVKLLKAMPWPDRIFLTPRGKAWTEANRGGCVKMFHRICKLAGVARKDAEGRVLDVHALRVTAITRMLRRGVPPHIVARVVGHKDPGITLRIYADVHAEDMRKALRKAWRKK